jgi:putative transposase
MQLVEQHLIRRSASRYRAIDQAAFAAKNLYNQALYQIRQSFIHEGKYLPYAEIFHLLKQHETYHALPAKVANSILIQLHKNWLAFFGELAAYRADPSKFLGRPCIPGYKDQEKGRSILIYDKQALGKRAFKKTGKLIPSRSPRNSPGNRSIRSGLCRVAPAISWRSFTHCKSNAQPLTPN